LQSVLLKRFETFSRIRFTLLLTTILTKRSESSMKTVTILGTTLAVLMILSLPSWSAEDHVVVIDDAASVNVIIPELVSGNGKAELETKDVYKEDDEGKAALRVDALAGDFQRFNTNIPSLGELPITKAPKVGEYRYITFAWKKKGGTGVQLQLHATTNTWGHRYHAGDNMQAWNPSIQVTPDFPKDWQIHTRDLFEDWGEMVVTGLAFSCSSLDYAIWDHVVFHRTEEDPLAPQAVEPGDKLPLTWGKLKRPEF
jgi:hypothetical protein